MKYLVAVSCPLAQTGSASLTTQLLPETLTVGVDEVSANTPVTTDSNTTAIISATDDAVYGTAISTIAVAGGVNLHGGVAKN
jgi:hypothetical protein